LQQFFCWVCWLVALSSTLFGIKILSSIEFLLKTNLATSSKAASTLILSLAEV